MGEAAATERERAAELAETIARKIRERGEHRKGG